eukprot:3343196-Ditylum_brightwellii.AAC.1
MGISKTVPNPIPNVNSASPKDDAPLIQSSKLRLQSPREIDGQLGERKLCNAYLCTADLIFIHDINLDKDHHGGLPIFFGTMAKLPLDGSS